MREETGQTLVQVTLMLVVLLGFAALAIDAGFVYSERRHMQNAADAGALAGAREMCITGDQRLAEAAARRYALTENGAASVDVLFSGEGGNIVNVTAHIPADPILAGVIGGGTTNVGADAAAACGAATSACGLWPIAFEHELWDSTGCGQDMVVWNAMNEGQNVKCSVNGETRPICDCYDCEDGKNGENGIDDGPDDFVVVTTVSRGWLDLSDMIDPRYRDICSGGGANLLRCWILSNTSAPVSLSACIPGNTGVKTADLIAANDRAQTPENVVSIPLFSETGCDPTSIRDTYQIDGFGCVTVVPELGKQYASMKLSVRLDQPGNDQDKDTNKEKIIRVTRNCEGGCMTSCGSTDGRPPEDWELRAVNLIK
jgi:hypothetical protein